MIDNMSIVAAMMTGFIMAMIRVSEPYFKFLIKKQIMEWFGILMDEKETENSESYMNDTLSTFLTSSLNVELVHVILKAITKHSKGKITGKAHPVYSKDDFKMEHKFIIDSIKIQNPDDWKVAKLPDFIAKQ